MNICACGCGTEIAARSKNKGEPKRFAHGHNSRGEFLPLDRYEVVDCGFKTPCHLWQGATQSRGYGQAQGGRLVHRLIYEQAHGQIPKGLVIDHLCNVRACMNIDHLRATTNGENIARGWALKFGRPDPVFAGTDAARDKS